ncbi:MAG: acyl-CoA dehydrogenase family protein, partial [Blastocatellia bacterium]
MVHPASHAFLKQYEKAEAFEQYLGDSFDPSRPFSFKRCVELDELEVYPQQACDQINDWGFHLQYIPQQFGGAFRSFEEFFALLRLLARRDLTVVVAHAKTYLGSIGVWLSGSDQQKQRLAQIIKEGGQVALALTEKEHGSDLLATEVTATKTAGGYILSGEKWLINNATRCAAFTLFARTDSA